MTTSLAALINKELNAAAPTTKKTDRPTLHYGQASQVKKGEDFYLVKTDCVRTLDDENPSFGVFAIFDGHNGRAAAVYSKENLLKDILSAIPQGVRTRSKWLAALPRAMVAGFVKTDKEFQKQEQSSGTTVTLVVVDGWTLTVASVGDSRCILQPRGGAILPLTVDHRLEVNTEERDRVKASGGVVGRLSIVGGAEIGPLRCWPGGLCLSRSIGDLDVGEFIVPIPHVKQIRLSPSGARLITASDGVWDALNSERAVGCCNGLTADLAAEQIVKEAIRLRGLRDDTTCLVVDVLPTDNFPTPAASVERSRDHRLWNRLFSTVFKRNCGAANRGSKSGKLTSEAGKVEEIFEEGSAVLAERLGGSEPAGNGGVSVSICAICQVDINPNAGISVHSGSSLTAGEAGPFLCLSCKQKQNAMEGRCYSRAVWVG